MATPARMVQLCCPSCQSSHWTIDCDYTGAHPLGKKELYYDEREYTCPNCGKTSCGYIVLQKSPVEFFLQPSEHYPMSQQEFDHWLRIFKAYFPDHPRLSRVGKDWHPLQKPKLRKGRTVLNVIIGGTAGIVTVVLLFFPLTTGTRDFLFFASIAVLLACHVVLKQYGRKLSQRRTEAAS